MTAQKSTESKDPFLAEYKEKLGEVLKGMKSVGSSQLRLLIVEMIRSRWIRDKRTSYGFEVAWVFDRKEEAMARILRELEEAGDVEQVSHSRGKESRAGPYRPRSLRKKTLSR